MKRKEMNAHLLHRRRIRLQRLAQPLPRADMLRALPRRAAQRMRQRLGRNGLMARGLRRRNRERQVGVLSTSRRKISMIPGEIPQKACLEVVVRKVGPAGGNLVRQLAKRFRDLGRIVVLRPVSAVIHLPCAKVSPIPSRGPW